MDNSTAEFDELPIAKWRLAKVVAIVFLSLIVGVGVCYWHVLQEIAAENTPNEMRNFHGSLKDGELWYEVTDFSDNPFDPKMTTRIKRLNLETGEQRNADFDLGDINTAMPVWIGDTLYLSADNAIYQVNGTSLIRLEPAPFASCLSLPFEYDGHVTVVYDGNKLNDNRYDNVHLTHWVDGQWIVGRAILLPSGEQRLYDDPQRGRKVLLPRSSASNGQLSIFGTNFGPPSELTVTNSDHASHLLMTSMSGMQAVYRLGFEFRDTLAECASAIAPENAPRDIWGWEPVLSNQADDDWVQMVSDRHGLLFAAYIAAYNGESVRFIRHYPDGRVVELDGYSIANSEDQFPWIVANSSEDISYVISGDQNWGSATIRRIEGETVHPPHLFIPGFQQEYLDRWKRVMLRLASVWILPMAVLLACTSFVTRRAALTPFQSNRAQVLLAAVWRRALALVIDVAFVFAVSRLLWQVYLGCFGLKWPIPDEPGLADSLVGVDWGIRTGELYDAYISLAFSPLNWITLPFDLHSPFFGILVASILPACALKVYLESRTGQSPGKWLLGIRTVQTTLKPIGFASVLVRNLLYCVDFPLMLTPIPAAISLILSNRIQRIGDRVADTIVIRS